jgi:excisionase family DNA binding protein
MSVGGILFMTMDGTSESGFEPRIGRSVSLDHAAELLGVSRRTIYNRIRDGRLQTIRTLGGSQRVLIDSVADAETAPPTTTADAINNRV